MAVGERSQDTESFRSVLVILDLAPRMLLSVARTPGQCVADEKQLHVVIWKGWQPVVHMVLAPLCVGGKSHCEASVVGEVFSQSKVSVHR